MKSNEKSGDSDLIKCSINKKGINKLNFILTTPI